MPDHSAASDLTEESLLRSLDQVCGPISSRPRLIHWTDWQLKKFFGWTDEEIADIKE